jgi:hypothetical protein
MECHGSVSLKHFTSLIHLCLIAGCSETRKLPITFLDCRVLLVIFYGPLVNYDS